ncbi:MAG: hypothetical protein QE285_04045 [Aquabacterium sp.]|nr:hypothetical protein [Aquabacterium sp.]
MTKLPETSVLRTVVFLTAPNDDSIPHAAASMACLQPLAWSSFAERVMQSCALADIQDIDVVACDHPELLRLALGNGQRWGLRLRWHLVKDGHAPYGVLRQLSLGASRVLVGHAHCWLDPAALGDLLREDCAAVVLEPDRRWTGWASMPAADAAAISPHADADTLAHCMTQSAPGRCMAIQTSQFLTTGTAQDLLESQRVCLAPDAIRAAPATWLHKPWGLQSSDARVSPDAVITGPAVIGPGCVVGAAVVGAHTVLHRDVVVAGGASVEYSLVMAGTYVGADVSVLHSVARGSVVNHVGWGVHHELPVADAVLTPLTRPEGVIKPLVTFGGRLLAGVVLAAGLPALLALQLASRLKGSPSPWLRIDAVRGWNADGSLHLMPVRMNRRDSGRTHTLLSSFGAVLDVLQGRRAWFGVRPRQPGDWYALNRDWQRLLARQPIGFFHARAWHDDGLPSSVEAQAVADAFFAASGTLRERVAAVAGAQRSWRPTAHCVA